LDEESFVQQTELMNTGATEISPSFLNYLKNNLGMMRTKFDLKSPRSKNGTTK